MSAAGWVVLGDGSEVEQRLERQSDGAPSPTEFSMREFVFALLLGSQFLATIFPQFVDGIAVSPSPQLADVSRGLRLSVCFPIPAWRVRARGHTLSATRFSTSPPPIIGIG
jgi:hypothetical protein